MPILSSKLRIVRIKFHKFKNHTQCFHNSTKPAPEVCSTKPIGRARFKVVVRMKWIFRLVGSSGESLLMKLKWTFQITSPLCKLQPWNHLTKIQLNRRRSICLRRCSVQAGSGVTKALIERNRATLRWMISSMRCTVQIHTASKNRPSADIMWPTIWVKKHSEVTKATAPAISSSTPTLPNTNQ